MKRKPRWKVLTACLLILILALPCAGCWNRREIQDLAFVTALGIDKGPEEGTVKLTVHIAKPFAIVGAEGGGSLEKPFLVATSTGETTFEAVRNFIKSSPRRLNWTHNRFVLFGEAFAREGIIDPVNWLGRDAETRRSTLLIVAYNATAEELLQAEFELERMPAAGAESILNAAQTGLSTVIISTINDFLINLKSEGIEPIGTRAQVIPIRPDKTDPDRTDIEGELLRNHIGLSAMIGGTAVFNGDKLAGFMDERETRGYNWIMGQVRSTILSFNHPHRGNKKMSLEIIRTKSSITPQIDSDEILFNVKIDVLANIGETSWPPGALGDVDTITLVEERANALIKGEAENALVKAQELNVDVFGFGREIHRRNPQIWTRIKEQWVQLFPWLNVQIEVNTRIQNSGMVRF
ncbi:MAG: Ger(x)C family spore germination protein [Syntrophomonadales bacterium]